MTSPSLSFFVERQNHAREMIKTYDLSSITGIVISSGDGLVYEVTRTMMPDLAGSFHLFALVSVIDY